MLGCFRSQPRVNGIVVNRTFVLATFSRLNMHIHRSIPFSIPFYLFHSTKDNTPCFFARVAKMVLIREAVGGLIKFFQQANDCATQRTFLLCLFNTTRRCLRSLSPPPFFCSPNFSLAICFDSLPRNRKNNRIHDDQRRLLFPIALWLTSYAQLREFHSIIVTGRS